MRGLSEDEHAILSGHRAYAPDGRPWDPNAQDGAKLLGLLDSLIERGCVQRVWCSSTRFGHVATDLGRLALRVHDAFQKARAFPR